MEKLNTYQTDAVSFAVYPREIFDRNGYIIPVYPALGLSSEAGEVANKVKKIIRDGNEQTPEKRQQLLDELGDVLWYLANLAGDLGFTLEQVANRNIEKLADRTERGTIHGSGDDR